MDRSLSSVATLGPLPMALAAIAVSMSLMRRVCSGRIILIPSVEVTRKTSRYHSRKMLQAFQEATDTKSPSPFSQSLAAKAVVAQLSLLLLRVQQPDRWRLASQSPTQSPAPTVQLSQRLVRPPPLARVATTAVKVALTSEPSLLG